MFDNSIIDKYAKKKVEEKPLNWEKIPRTPTGQTELQYTTYGNTRNEEPDLNEFLCIGLEVAGDSYPFVTIEYCQDKAIGQGCKEIKECECYKKQKELQENHPEINWEEPHKNKEFDKNRIKFIKKGAIIEK